MKKSVISILILITTIPGLAATICTEPFDYPVGSLEGQNGGTGWGDAWTFPSTSGTQEVVAESLLFSDLPVSGGALKLVDTDPAWSVVGVRRQLGFDFPTGADLWVSFLARIDQPEPDNASRTAEFRHGPTVGTTKLRMAPKGTNSQGVRIAYDSDASNSASENVQDGRTYLFLCRFGDIGTADGKFAVMWVLEEAGYDAMAADGLITEDELADNAYLIAQDPHANRKLDALDSAYLLLANSQGDTFGYYFDELRYGMSIQDVIPDETEAREPSPFWGESDVKPTAELTWTAGTDATAHQVYFGTDRDAVTNATTSDPMGVYMGQFDAAQYSPTGMETATRYFWRVDEVTSSGVNKGYVWDFWTLANISIDDFESYADTAQLREVWQDYIVNDSGATTEYSTVSNNGTGSMMYTYESQYGDSYADLVYLSAQDWDMGGIMLVMDIWFRGTAGNSTDETMYVTVEDSTGSATVNYPNSADLTDETWRVWHIDLSEFSGVDLTDVRKFTIGFTGGSFGSGEVYFDDIGIHPCRPGALVSDLNGDCTVDIQDFGVLAREWLQVKTY
ncbi:hypothetical protein SMSP2_02063 [Limihaloglobus sulfuriphilus]|uniref:CBM11 domain-containing protein n=1 Tax=Limihaloglobus sulfuriphilus TaxID=1851148 RepID=A0A1R7T5S4_9BACT|nr:hypothetical protein [Limihaloglobus sulfuriphilus]AQQ71686.1 hypothetical protein SMSP2_02063 [Limihaloglobus sulfuriphilus]